MKTVSAVLGSAATNASTVWPEVCIRSCVPLSMLSPLSSVLLGRVAMKASTGRPGPCMHSCVQLLSSLLSVLLPLLAVIQVPDCPSLDCLVVVDPRRCCAFCAMNCPHGVFHGAR